MLRANSNVGFYKVMEDVRLQLVRLDSTRKGALARHEVIDVLLKMQGDSALIDEILPSFVDSTDLVRWVEMLAFIACCSTWYTIRHLYHLNQIRKKQGR